MATIWTEVEVDVNLDDFDDDELLEEIELRDIETNRSKIIELYDEIRKPGSDQQRLLTDFFWNTIGRNY